MLLVGQECNLEESTCQWRRLKRHRLSPSLLREYPTCPGAVKPKRRMRWGRAPEPEVRNGSSCLGEELSSAAGEELPLSTGREEPAHTEAQRGQIHKQIKIVYKREQVCNVIGSCKMLIVNSLEVLGNSYFWFAHVRQSFYTL